MLIVELEKYYFCSTHLSLHTEDRDSSADIILSELSALDKPVIIAGDFNATPDEESIKHLTEGFHFVSSPTKLTFPADKPEIEIDYIGLLLARATEIEEVETYVVEAAVESDHRPLVSEIDFKKR